MGNVIPIVRYIGGYGGGQAPFAAAYEFFDTASKAVWYYNPGQNPEIAGASYAIEGWVQANCMGTAYIFYPPPGRYAFRIASDPSKYYVVPDNASEAVVAATSTQQGGSCGNGAISGPAVLVSSLIAVTIPSNPPGTPPYHVDTP